MSQFTLGYFNKIKKNHNVLYKNFLRKIFNKICFNKFDNNNE